jgi:hypothetical protein
LHAVASCGLVPQDLIAIQLRVGAADQAPRSLPLIGAPAELWTAAASKN